MRDCMLGRRLVAATLVASILGCTTVRPVSNPAEFIPAKQPKLLWVTQQDGKSMLLVNARVEDNHIVGQWRGRWEEEVRVPLTEAPQVEAKQIEVKRTAILTSVLAVTGGLAVAWLLKGGAPAVPCNNPQRYDVTSCN